MKSWRAQLLLLVAAVGLAPLVPAGFALRSLLAETARPLLGPEMKNGVDTALELTRELMEAERIAFRDQIEAGALVDTLDRNLSDSDRHTLEALKLQPGDDPVRVELESGLGFVALATATRPGDDEVFVESAPGAPSKKAQTSGAWVFAPLSETLVTHSRNVESAVRRMESFRRDREAWLSSALGAFFIVELGILALALGLGILLTRRLTAPITALEGGIERVAQGDLETSVRPRGHPELKVVLDRFNRMVSQLRSQQAELLRLEKQTAWQQMARSLAHEIKNPLTPIQLATEEVHNAYRGDDESFRILLDESTRIIEEEISRLRELVAGFSQLAKPATSSQSVDIAEVAVDLGRVYGDRVQIDVSSADAFLPTVRGDLEALRRVLLNLINNGLQAQDAAGRDGPVKLRLRSTDREVFVTVSDHGEGVPEENRARIFEPDFTTRSDGIGLGLAIARSTVEGHGGTLELVVPDSPTEAAEPGSTFLLTLPRRNGDSA